MKVIILFYVLDEWVDEDTSERSTPAANTSLPLLKFMEKSDTSIKKSPARNLSQSGFLKAGSGGDSDSVISSLSSNKVSLIFTFRYLDIK